MNAARRKELSALADRWAEIKESMTALKDDLEQVRDAEQEALDARPESFREGEQGQASQGFIEAMETGISDIETLIDGDGMDFDQMYDAV